MTDLTKILKPGDKVYCILAGYVTVKTIGTNDPFPIIIEIPDSVLRLGLTKNGQFLNSNFAPCIIFKDEKLTPFEEIELPFSYESCEKTFPRLMLVKNIEAEEWKKRIVLAKYKNLFLSTCGCDTFEELEKQANSHNDKYFIIGWKYAKEIEINELSIDEIEERLNIPKGTLKIKYK